MTGAIKDRLGRPIAGARVFLAGQYPTTTTDAAGRFALAGIEPGKTVVLAEKAGFRLRGWLADPLANAEMGSLTLSSTDEAAEPFTIPAAETPSLKESRALAERLLGYFLNDKSNHGNDHLKLAGIVAVSGFDPVRALELLENGGFVKDPSYTYAQGEVAAGLAEINPARAAALVQAIPDSRAKVSDLVAVAKALPASERARKIALLEQATGLVKDLAPYAQLHGPLPSIAETLLDLGERERARLLLRKGIAAFDSLPPGNAGTLTSFLTLLARLEPDQAIERLRKLPSPAADSTAWLPYDAAAAVAVGLATDRPADAEHALNLWKRHGIQWQTNRYVLQICRRLGEVDPAIARRVAAAQRGPAERALAWAYVGLGLAKKDKVGVLDAVDHAIAEIDHLRESGPGIDLIVVLSDVLLMYPTNPAVLILPVVERAAPERLGDVFWRAVALHPRLEADQQRELRNSYVGFECMLLARYDRAIAGAVFTPLDRYLHSLALGKGVRNAFASSHLVAKGCIDPRAAVELTESLTPPAPFDPPMGESSTSNPAYTARMVLAKMLGLPAEKRWPFLWLRLGAHLALED